MTRYVVELYGLPSEITELRKIEVELEDGTKLGDVIAALRREIPPMEGQVICTGEDRLTDRHVFNINGRFYFENCDLQLQAGDRIALLTLAVGG